MYPEKIRPLFIIGNGRSGTTMVGALLTELGVGKSFEAQFLPKIIKKYGNAALTPVQQRECVDDILAFGAARKFGVTKDAIDEHNSILTCELIDKVLSGIAVKDGHTNWIDKTPFYIHDITTLLRVFPKAKFIWCVRDGRDVYLSVSKKSWGANNIYQAAKSWQLSNYENPSLRELNDDQLIQIRYEDILFNPTQELTRILRFLDIPLSNKDIQCVSDKVNTKNSGKWREGLTKKQKNVFDAIAFDALRELGYPSENEKRPVLNKATILYYELENRLKLYHHLFKINVWDNLQIYLGRKRHFDD